MRFISILTALPHKPSLLKALLTVLLIGWMVVLLSNYAQAKYLVVSIAPKSFLDQTQQAHYHERLQSEYYTYDKNPSKRVIKWHEKLMNIRTTNAIEKLNSIHKHTGSMVRYKTERTDFWSTPGETIARGYGDCDDYAHIYLASAALHGFDQKNLWLVAGTVHGRHGRIGHAIAVIETSKGEQLILDNLYSKVVHEKYHTLFKPSYEINMEEQAAFYSINTQFKSAF